MGSSHRRNQTIKNSVHVLGLLFCKKVVMDENTLLNFMRAF